MPLSEYQKVSATSDSSIFLKHGEILFVSASRGHFRFICNVLTYIESTSIPKPSVSSQLLLPMSFGAPTKMRLTLVLDLLARDEQSLVPMRKCFAGT